MKTNPLVMPIQMWKAGIDFWQGVAAAQLQMSRCALSIMGLWPSEQLKSLGKSKLEKSNAAGGKSAVKPAARPAARLVSSEAKPQPAAAEIQPAKPAPSVVEPVPAKTDETAKVKAEPGQPEVSQSKPAENQAGDGAATDSPAPQALTPSAAAGKPAAGPKPARNTTAAHAAKAKPATRRKAEAASNKTPEPAPLSDTRH